MGNDQQVGAKQNGINMGGAVVNPMPSAPFPSPTIPGGSSKTYPRVNIQKAIENGDL